MRSFVLLALGLLSACVQGITWSPAIDSKAPLRVQLLKKDVEATAKEVKKEAKEKADKAAKKAKKACDDAKAKTAKAAKNAKTEAKDDIEKKAAAWWARA
ncbi:hypothetical protein M885DRAFT_521004 [Pelagophyceae sp. CCMP2097]|nr:hypothetical protein M885DRAFT_521004 [Pelagophyceae sp. CCMP2097]